MPDALRLALGTLTRVPVPAPRSVDRRTAGIAISLSPLVGLVLAVLCGLPLLLADDSGVRLALLAVITLALLAWATRALHLDGLADTADALGSGKPAAAALEIARKSDIGPFGVISLVFVLVIDVIAMTCHVTAGTAYLAFVIAVVVGRVTLTLACTRMWPAARPDGLGAAVAGSIPVLVAVVWCVLSLAFSGWLAGIDGVLGAALGLFAGLVVLTITRRRLGGVTGDVLGAAIEVSTAVTLVVLALLA